MHKFLIPKQALEEVTLVTILVLACESLGSVFTLSGDKFESYEVGLSVA